MALSLGNFALALGALTAFYAISKLWTRVWLLFNTPLRNLRGPKNESMIWGNLKTVFASEDAVIYEAWLKEYGKAFSYHAFFGKYRLFTTDTRAIAHIFSNSHIWVKPELARRGLATVLGEGILSAEGEQHRRQRRTMNPAFGVAQIRELTDIFLEKSAELRDIWRAQVTAGGGEARVDALSSMSKAALDIIGVAGFDYHFDALKERQNELSDAFKSIFGAAMQPRTFDIFKEFIPGFKWIPDERTRTSDNARKTMSRIGMELINEKKRAIRGGDSKSAGRDLLSLLIRANMDKDVPPHLRLTDEEVLGQVPTFLVAGHETTATTTAWCLYALSIHPEIQTQLRDELLAVSTENPTMDDLNALPYLDAVVRETLRLYSVVASTLRSALEDDVIPLSSPITDRKGQVMNEIKVQMGDVIFVPITVLNRAEDIWGSDAHEFRPERWMNMSEKASNIPGIFAGLATFIGGPRSCIGYRFAIVEFKALLFHVVRSFNVALAVPPEQIGHKSTFLSRPMLKTDGSNQVPLLITPV
ncbi:cytochrome P450, partial [Exidia glandulosa HHB12029]